MNATTENSGPTTTPEPNIQPRSKTLTRSTHDRMLAGVASGIGAYIGVDALLVRIAFAVLTVVGGLGIPLYVACWLLIPDEDTAQSIAGDFVSSIKTRRN